MGEEYEGEHDMTVLAGGGGITLDISVTPQSMTFEDYYAGFAAGAPDWLTVSPRSGRLDKKGGEDAVLTISATPAGACFEGVCTLVLVLPDDIDMAYKINLKSATDV